MSTRLLSLGTFPEDAHKATLSGYSPSLMLPRQEMSGNNLSRLT